MRVSLFYNKKAGDGVPLDRIRDAIEQRGHELVRLVEKRTKVERLLEERPDIVVAAGGDGTIADAARLLARRGIPLAILPPGTANNIAKRAWDHGVDRGCHWWLGDGWAPVARPWRRGGRLGPEALRILGMLSGASVPQPLMTAECVVGQGISTGAAVDRKHCAMIDPLPYISSAVRLSRSIRLGPYEITVQIGWAASARLSG